ncbi:MAG: protein tyrosine phosphatase family protein [Gemmatimonadetes bacterium]|jgi:protein tyrosine phosphatase (PTP) superfamily phosphohydrolase (DUF442 family)|nr:protein tyrosine phosphatase family protein [Gemmatimonadota bacterium]
MKKMYLIPAVFLSLTLLAHPVRAQQNAPPALETIRNFQVVSPQLASAGQIGYEQIPLLGAQGYEVVVNLAVADEARNGQEGFLVAQSGLTYVHIPVDWEQPKVSDVAMFFDVMRANADRKIFVHCFANMRASAFVYMYRTLVEGVPEDEARATMNAVWDPNTMQQWADLIERVKASEVRER